MYHLVRLNGFNHSPLLKNCLQKLKISDIRSVIHGEDTGQAEGDKLNEVAGHLSSANPAVSHVFATEDSRIDMITSLLGGVS